MDSFAKQLSKKNDEFLFVLFFCQLNNFSFAYCRLNYNHFVIVAIKFI